MKQCVCAGNIINYNQRCITYSHKKQIKIHFSEEMVWTMYNVKWTVNHLEYFVKSLFITVMNIHWRSKQTENTNLWISTKTRCLKRSIYMTTYIQMLYKRTRKYVAILFVSLNIAFCSIYLGSQFPPLIYLLFIKPVNWMCYTQTYLKLTKRLAP